MVANGCGFVVEFLRVLTKINIEMEINQDYMHFKRWYKDTERAIHCGQWDDEQIAYAGYCEGMKRVKTCNKPAVISSVCPICDKIDINKCIYRGDKCSICIK